MNAIAITVASTTPAIFKYLANMKDSVMLVTTHAYSIHLVSLYFSYQIFLFQIYYHKLFNKLYWQQAQKNY